MSTILNILSCVSDVTILHYYHSVNCFYITAWKNLLEMSLPLQNAKNDPVRIRPQIYFWWILHIQLYVTVLFTY